MWRKLLNQSNYGLRLVSNLRRRGCGCTGTRTSFRSTGHSSPKTDSPSVSTALKNIIFDKIRINGPISVADYMKLAASGYYSTKAADDADYGIGGDFVTSPEISQMFGELIGIWCGYETWKMGRRDEWQLIELGPGNGSLMFDCLNTLQQTRLVRNDDDPHHRLSVHLVELSDALAAKQERLLCEQGPPSSAGGQAIQESPTETSGSDDRVFQSFKHFKRNTTKFGSPVFWYKDLDDVPRHFCAIVAHEFFDALPVHKFQRIADGKWREVYVDADFENRRLKFALAPSESFAQRTYLTKEILERLPPDVDHLEISPQSTYLLQQSIARITENGGAVLIIDYGYDNGKGGDTLRAFRKHQFVDDFLNEEPGSFDITTDVNFSYLKRIAEEKACCFGPISQGEFLKNLGIDIRLQRLLNMAKSEEEKDYLQKSYAMLVGDDQMGSKFKAFAIFPKVLKPYLALRPPAGFCDLR